MDVASAGFHTLAAAAAAAAWVPLVVVSSLIGMRRGWANVDEGVEEATKEEEEEEEEAAASPIVQQGGWAGWQWSKARSLGRWWWWEEGSVSV